MCVCVCVCGAIVIQLCRACFTLFVIVMIDSSGAFVSKAGMAIGELRPGKFSLPLMVPGSIRAPLKGAMLEAEVRWL